MAAAIFSVIGSAIFYEITRKGGEKLLTKYASGHGDVMGGAIIADRAILSKLRGDANVIGAALDPHAAFLIQRGLRTYFVRYETQCRAAQRIAEGTALELKMVECRGTQVWPKTSAELDPTDVMRARFITRGSVITSEDILELLGRFGGRFNWVHVEKLRMFDGEPSFSRAQGEK